MFNKKNIKTHILMFMCLIIALMIVTVFEWDGCNSILMTYVLLDNPSVFLLGFIALVISFLSQRTILPYCIPVEYFVGYLLGTTFGFVPSGVIEGDPLELMISPVFSLFYSERIWFGSYLLMLIITLIIDIIIIKRRDKVPKSLWRDDY